MHCGVLVSEPDAGERRTGTGFTCMSSRRGSTRRGGWRRRRVGRARWETGRGYGTDWMGGRARLVWGRLWRQITLRASEREFVEGCRCMRRDVGRSILLLYGEALRSIQQMNVVVINNFDFFYHRISPSDTLLPPRYQKKMKLSHASNQL